MDEKKERHIRKFKRWISDDNHRKLDCQVTQSKIGNSISHDEKWDHINKIHKAYYEFRNFNGLGILMCVVFSMILASRAPILWIVPLWLLVLVVFTVFYLIIRIKKKILNNSAGYWNAVEKFETDYNNRKVNIEKLKKAEIVYDEKLANAEGLIESLDKDPLYKNILETLIKLDHKLINHCISVEDQEKLKIYLKVGTSRKETWKAISGDLNNLDYSHKWLWKEVIKVFSMIWMIPKYIGIGFWKEFKKSDKKTNNIAEYSNPDMEEASDEK